MYAPVPGRKRDRREGSEHILQAPLSWLWLLPFADPVTLSHMVVVKIACQLWHLRWHTGS
jgi:hypothetical protein